MMRSTNTRAMRNRHVSSIRLEGGKEGLCTSKHPEVSFLGLDGVTWGLYREHIGIMENKMETTIV